ncbi:hypothetical protein GQ457_16G009000 [Hibiscus cannabinus]
MIIDFSKRKQIVIFLDYNGTLSPIVADSDQAFMSKKISHFITATFIVFFQELVRQRCSTGTGWVSIGTARQNRPLMSLSIVSILIVRIDTQHGSGILVRARVPVPSPEYRYRGS